MKKSSKLKKCREINTCPIYQEYSCGIRCCCFRDVSGNEYLQVMDLDSYHFLNSPRCNDWDEDYITEWVISATQALKDKLGIGVEV